MATAPSSLLAAAIVRDFTAQEALEAELIKAATGQFGSGWAWVVLDAGKLRVVATSNAENPMTLGQVPLVVVDVGSTPITLITRTAARIMLPPW